MPSVSTQLATELDKLISVKSSFHDLQAKREALEKVIAIERDAKHSVIDSSMVGLNKKEAYLKVAEELSDKRLKSAEMKTDVNVLSAKYCGQRRKVQILIKELGISIQDDLQRD